MCTRVFTLLALFVGLAHSFSWDIVVAKERRLEFFYNGAVTYTKDIQSAQYISAVSYDPVDYRVLMFDIHSSRELIIYSFDLRTWNLQTLVTKFIRNAYYKSLAYDPLTQLLFWTEETQIYSLSLKPASRNIAVGGNLLVTSDNYCTAIAVDSCGGYIYWATADKIERAAFDGSKREVLIYGHVYWRRGLAIDQEMEKMYWIDETKPDQFSIECADLNGKNRRTFYFIGTQYRASALAVSNDFIYWWSYNQSVILQLPKNQNHGVAPVVYSQYSREYCWFCHLTAANYKIEGQTLGNKFCEARKSLIRHGSICDNYCFKGSCSVSAEGYPRCSCNSGYSGERCEVDACHKHCFNDGVCLLNEAGKPVCQCTAEYQGERCDVPIWRDYCMQGKYSVSTKGQPTCSCEAGYSGERCEVNACYMYCLNNGVCSVNEAGKAVCQCTEAYQGERCDVSVCNDYCLHGDCSLSTEGQRTCSCDRGYSGERCDVSICKNYCFNGNCIVSAEGQATCRCYAGYSGERCEVNACHSYCLNNGECSLNEEDEPVCQCTADYEGDRCDVATALTDVCGCADKMTQQTLQNLRSKVNQFIRQELQCTL